jgi:hypothetical protein
MKKPNIQQQMVIIQNHIKEYYSDIDSLKADVISASTNNKIDYQGAKHMVTGGSFLIYYTDINKFMRKAGFDGRYSNEHMWELYIDNVATHILALAKDTNLWK